MTLGDGDHLTAREVEHLRLVICGYSPTEIAARQGVSPRTVYDRHAVVLAKIGVSSRSELFAWALEQGMCACKERGRP